MKALMIIVLIIISACTKKLDYENDLTIPTILKDSKERSSI